MKTKSLAWASVAVALFAVGAIYQNCGPAKLTGTSSSSSSQVSQSDTFSPGSKVDLVQLRSTSPRENINNVLFPSPTETNNFDYANGTAVIENVVLLNSDFNQIIWVHGPSSTISSVGLAFNKAALESADLGDYYVFGFRGNSSFLITQFNLIPKGSTNLGAGSVGAVTVNNSVASTQGSSETVLVTVDAPAVDLKTVEFSVRGAVTRNQRGILVTKLINETLNVELILTDAQGGTLQRTINLPAKTTPVTIPTTTTMPPTTTLPPTTTTTTTTTTTLPPTTTTTTLPFQITVQPAAVEYGADQAYIRWATSNFSNAWILYGTTTALGTATAQETSFNYASHMMRLTGLSPNTTYYYKVVSRNSSNQTIESAIRSFTTTATGGWTQASNPAASLPFQFTVQPYVNEGTSTSVAVRWVMSDFSTGDTDYGLTTAYGQKYSETTFNYAGHRQVITGLAPNTLYNFRVTSRNRAGQVISSQNLTFRTAP